VKRDKGDHCYQICIEQNEELQFLGDELCVGKVLKVKIT